MSRKKGPKATYQHCSGELAIDKEFYSKLALSSDYQTRGFELVNKFEISIRSGKAWEVKKGQICRILEVEGPQVGDFNVWNRHDPREKMWATRTRQIQSSHLYLYDRIYSTLPFLRPILTCVGNSLESYGVDEDGGRVHDLLGSRCDPYVNRLLTGKDFNYNCHSNLVRAVLPFGLTEYDVHDVLNIFQCTGLNEEGKYYMKPCPGKKGDFLDFFAEIDVLMALSACPSGAQTKDLWGPEAEDLLDVCHPLGVEVYQPSTEILKNWKGSSEKSQYAGLHGLKAPAWGTS